MSEVQQAEMHHFPQRLLHSGQIFLHLMYIFHSKCRFYGSCLRRNPSFVALQQRRRQFSKSSVESRGSSSLLFFLSHGVILLSYQFFIVVGRAGCENRGGFHKESRGAGSWSPTRRCCHGADHSPHPPLLSCARPRHVNGGAAATLWHCHLCVSM